MREAMESTTCSVQEPVKETLKVERGIDLGANGSEVDSVCIVLDPGHIVVGTHQYDMGANLCFDYRAKKCERSTVECIPQQGKNALVQVESKSPIGKEEPAAVPVLT